VWLVAALVAVLVSARETINADDQPSRVVSDANDHFLSMPRWPHTRGAGASNSRPSSRGRYGVAGVSIGLEKAPALFGMRRCEHIFDADP
jgi:hypothetical protein